MQIGTIGVILGGPSEEREISIRTGRAIANALRLKGYAVTEIGEEGNIEDKILTSGIDVAFIALHGRYGEDGTIQKFFENEGIPYTGSDPVASYNALDKFVSKTIFEKNNINTPEYIAVNSGESDIFDQMESMFSFPVVVKPADSGSSMGLSIVSKSGDLKRALDTASGYNSRIIIEKYIPGKELTVGILDQAPLPVIEIVPAGGFYSYDAKYTKGKTEYIVPADLPADIHKAVQMLALRAHQVLGCRDLSRVDIRLDPEGVPWVLEVNTIPGFTETSLLPKAAKAVGISFGDLCERILFLAWDRKAAEV